MSVISIFSSIVSVLSNVVNSNNLDSILDIGYGRLITQVEPQVPTAATRKSYASVRQLFHCHALVCLGLLRICDMAAEQEGLGAIQIRK